MRDASESVFSPLHELQRTQLTFSEKQKWGRDDQEKQEEEEDNKQEDCIVQVLVREIFDEIHAAKGRAVAGQERSPSVSPWIPRLMKLNSSWMR